MNKSNAENVRIKRDYFAHLKGPRRPSEASIDAVAKALSRFESYTRNKDFRTSRKEQAITFTAYLSRQNNERTGEPLSKATLRRSSPGFPSNTGSNPDSPMWMRNISRFH